ncbi:uncharacterized protein LOC112199518 [Rosa chinensis]|uniref:uncharacterized protein LOC112199518 n=1 Tax=Rosa chinensis TaxID=74649 RepID=UPI001AD8EBD8|nr:uncharacterized protein LOC112199518 [Rosa chinensis]
MAIVVSDQDADAGVFRSFSESTPFSYILKVESFSLLADDSIAETNVKCESGVFGAGGYNWKLVFYPNGNKKKNVKDHISLYLVMAGENSLQPGEEVYVDFRLFLLDQIKSKYLVVEDAFTRNFCFRREMSGAVGFDKLVSLRDFTDASSGYLIDDKCVFGAEVFVCNGRRPVPQADCLSIRKTTSQKYKHTWKVRNFSSLAAQCYEERFTAGGQKWKITLYPAGCRGGAGTHLSLFLALADPENLPDGTKISTNYCLRVVDQIHGRCIKHSLSGHIFSGTDKIWGWPRFITLDDFRREDKGFLRRDTCIVEAEFTINGTAMTRSCWSRHVGAAAAGGWLERARLQVASVGQGRSQAWALVAGRKDAAAPG